MVVTQSPEEVLRADKIVLPGVGHFQATQLLKDLGLTEAVREAVAKGAPFLGICVGLQWLYEGSTEAPETEGLGSLRVEVRALSGDVQSACGVEVAACGLEFAGADSAGFAAAARRGGWVRLFTSRTRGARRCQRIPRR